MGNAYWKGALIRRRVLNWIALHGKWLADVCFTVLWMGSCSVVLGRVMEASISCVKLFKLLKTISKTNSQCLCGSSRINMNEIWIGECTCFFEEKRYLVSHHPRFVNPATNHAALLYEWCEDVMQTIW